MKTELLVEKKLAQAEIPNKMLALVRSNKDEVHVSRCNARQGILGLECYFEDRVRAHGEILDEATLNESHISDSSFPRDINYVAALNKASSSRRMCAANCSLRLVLNKLQTEMRHLMMIGRAISLDDFIAALGKQSSEW